MRRTKIVCTLGPASNSEPVIKQMLLNGLNVARLNFSYGSHEDHAKTIETFRKVRDSLKLPAAVMLDTKGPEVRIKTVKDGAVEIENGSTFILSTKDFEGDSSKVSITYKDLPSQVTKGQRILIDDGKIILEVQDCTDTDIICRVLEGGILKNRKSINVPNTHLDMPYISEKDEADLIFGIEHNIDFVAASISVVAQSE